MLVVTAMKRTFLLAMILACSATTVTAQQYLIMPDSTNSRLVAFDPFDGHLVNSSMFGLNSGTTPLHAMQVGSEIWVSEQIGDKVSRYDLSGNSLGAVTGGMDNIRGMEQVGNTVYVSNSGTANGAPGPSLRMFDTSGNSLGSFATPEASSPFGALDFQGGLLVSSSNANDDIHKYSLTGTSLGTFHNSTTLNFAEQMAYAASGNILVAGFSTNNVLTLDLSGNVVSSFSASGARGVYQLGNGNIMWTSGAGASIFNVATGGNSLVYAGGGRYLDILTVPEPASFCAFALSGLALLRRRRKTS